MEYLGASIFPSTAGSDLVTSITTAISDNIAVVLTVVGFVVGVKLATRWLNKSLHGKVGG